MYCPELNIKSQKNVKEKLWSKGLAMSKEALFFNP